MHQPIAARFAPIDHFWPVLAKGRAARPRSHSAGATPAKAQASTENLRVDHKGLRGGPIEWTKDNHFRLKRHYRVYHRDEGKIALVKDWFAY